MFYQSLLGIGVLPAGPILVCGPNPCHTVADEHVILNFAQEMYPVMRKFAVVYQI